MLQYKKRRKLSEEELKRMREEWGDERFTVLFSTLRISILIIVIAFTIAFLFIFLTWRSYNKQYDIDFINYLKIFYHGV